MDYNKLVEKLQKTQNIYIYGAGIVAYGIYIALKELENLVAEAFVVSVMDDEKRMLAGKKIVELAEIAKNYENICFLIATPEVYHQEIKDSLVAKGFPDYICVDYKLEYAIMGRYLQMKNQLVLMEDKCEKRICNTVMSEKCSVLMAVSHKDKGLSADYLFPDWVRKIQVGAILTEERIAKLTDAFGGNISRQNPLYGELTATYWAWKNISCPIMGLFHYRRILEVTDEMLETLFQGDIDVILPLPFVCYPNTKGQYGRYILEEDMHIVWQVLEKHSQEYAGQAKEVLRNQYLYNYNMLIAREEVFKDYCNWMFPILQEICRVCEKADRNRLARYIGRIGEILTSIYFLVNERNWKVGHAMKRWLV